MNDIGILDLMKEIQWSGGDSQANPCCPCRGRYKPGDAAEDLCGHAGDCKLQCAMLALADRIMLPLHSSFV